MIDIQKLKQFPLAFKAFEGYIEKEHGSVLFIYSGSGLVRDEDFINFLDEQGVFICVSIYAMDNRFSFEIECAEDWYSEDNFYNIRGIATNEAILKAFELLENKLKTN